MLPGDTKSILVWSSFVDEGGHEGETNRERERQRQLNCVCVCVCVCVYGARSGAVGRGTALQAGRSRIRFPMVSLKFFIDIILPGSDRNEYQEYFPGVKTAGA